MPSTRDELVSFQEFVNERITSGSTSESLDELFTQWHESRCHDEVHQAIERGLSDIASARHTPAREAMESIRKDFGFANE